MMYQQNSEFTYRRVGTTGCEILDPNGVVVAWSVDEMWAAVIVARLNDNLRKAGAGTVCSGGLLPHMGLTAEHEDEK